MHEPQVCNVDPICPYCGDVDEPPRQSNYNCRACGNRVYIKSPPEQENLRPMTDMEAVDLELLSLRRKRFGMQGKQCRTDEDGHSGNSDFS